MVLPFWRALRVTADVSLSVCRANSATAGYVGRVTPARVRGCALAMVPFAGSTREQADASRRQSGPRKATLCRSITVRFRSKPCLSDLLGHWEKGGSRDTPARVRRDLQQANVGSKTRSAVRVSHLPSATLQLPGCERLDVGDHEQKGSGRD